MKIETRKIELGTFHLETQGDDKLLSSSHSQQSFKITDLQEDMLRQIAQGKTLEQISIEPLLKHHEFSFRELYKLIDILLKLSLITDPLVRNFFEPHDPHLGHEKSTRVAPTSGESSSSGNWNTQHLAELPFFRNLSSSLLKIFLTHAIVEKVPERTKIISMGDSERDLFVIFEGEASIYVPGVKHRHLITTIPAGSIFGEGGFFFGHPRSADVISNIPCVLARIKFDGHDFHSLIHFPGTHQLQQRLWILHGLLSSPIFHHVPAETMDRFVTAGKLKTLSPGQELFRQGDPGSSFFVVIQGQMDIFHNTKILRTLKQGDIFGEVALMINEGERTATAKALSEVLLMDVPHDEFFKVLSQNLILAKDIEEIAYRRYRSILR